MKPKGILRTLPARRAAFAPLVVCASICTAHQAAAASGTWIGTTSGTNWSEPANWAGNVIADGSGFTADFSTLDLPAGTFIVNLAVDRTIGNLNFNDTDAATTAGVWELAGANILTLAGTSPTITAGVNTNILAPLAGTSGFTKAGPGTLLLTANNNAAGNALTGSINLNAGQISIRNGAAIGPNTNPLNMANGTTFRIEQANGTTGAANFISVPITVAASSSATLSSSSAGNGFSGTVTGPANSILHLNGEVPFGVTGSQQFGTFLGTVNIPSGNALRFSSTSGPNGNGGQSTSFIVDGAIYTRNGASAGSLIHLGALTGSGQLRGQTNTAAARVLYRVGNLGTHTTFDGSFVDGSQGTAGLDKVGGGRLTLTGASTGTGPSTVTAGELRVNGSTAWATCTVQSGATLSGAGGMTGATTIANGGTLAPGDGGVGNITISSLTLATGSILNYNFGAGNDTITIPSGGTLALNAGIELNVNGFSADGTYNLIHYAAGVVPSGASAATAFTIMGGSGSKIYSVSDSGSAIRLTISSTDPTNYWDEDGGGSWNVTGNWSKNLIPNASGAIAKIGPGPGGVAGGFVDTEFTITLDANQTVGSLAFDDDSWGTAITIDPGTTTPGTLSFDNGASPAALSAISGNHTVNTDIGVDPDDLVVDVGVDTFVDPATPYTLTLNGAVSGGGASLAKAGNGTLVLSGDNTYDGGTFLNGGVVSIHSATSLGNAAGSVTFAGGTLRLAAPLAGIGRSYRVSGPANAVIDTNGNDFGYAGTISPVGGGTGGLTKTGAGTMTLSAAQTYTGTTTVAGGVLSLASGASISGANVATSGTAQLNMTAGTLNATDANLGVGSGGIFMQGGTAAFTGTVFADGSNGSTNSGPVRVYGGTLTAATLRLGRGGLITNTEPAAAPADLNLYVNGGSVNVTGSLHIGTANNTPNSSVVARVDAGTLTVGGALAVGLNHGDRWSYLDINGGNLVSTGTGADSGLVLSGPSAGKQALLMRAGTASVERIQFGRGAVNGTGLVKITGGTLYIGGDGIVTGSTGAYLSETRLAGGTIGAKADWSTSLGMNVTSASTIKTADASDAARNITISGALTGSGGITKTGGGTLTLGGANTSTGPILIEDGAVNVTGDSSGSTSEFFVMDGATLGGSGNIGGNVIVEEGGRQALAVAASPGSQTTRLISGMLDLSSGHIVDLTAAAAPEAGTYTLVTAAGGIDGTLASGTIHYNGIAGTLAVSGNSLVLTVTGGASGYDTWAAANNVTGGADDDDENDSIANVLEWVLGGNPKISDTNVLPKLTVNATNFVFTFDREDASKGEVALTFQYGGNLAGWTNVTIGDDNASSGPEVNITPNGTAPDTISVTIPKGANTRLFGRLQAVK